MYRLARIATIAATLAVIATFGISQVAPPPAVSAPGAAASLAVAPATSTSSSADVPT
jgi:hypothetical protein